VVSVAAQGFTLVPILQGLGAKWEYLGHGSFAGPCRQGDGAALPAPLDSATNIANYCWP